MTAKNKILCTTAEFRNISAENIIKNAVIYFWESHNNEVDDTEKIQATVDLIPKKFQLSSCEKYEMRTGYLSRFNYLSKAIESSSLKELEVATAKGIEAQNKWTKKYGRFIKSLKFIEEDWETYAVKSPYFDGCKELIQKKLESNETFYDAFSKTVDAYINKNNTNQSNGYSYIIEETSWILSLPLIHVNKPIYLIHIGNDNSAIRSLFNQFSNLLVAIKWLSPHFSHKEFINLSEFQLEYRAKKSFGYHYAIVNSSSVKRIVEAPDNINRASEELLLTLEHEHSEKELLSTIIGKLPGHVYWLNRDNFYLGCNSLQAQHFGLKSRKDVIGKTNYDLLENKEAQLLNQINTMVMETGVPQQVEESANMYNGFRDYLSIKEPLFNSDGKVIGLLGISVDITERKKAEQLQKENYALEKASKLVKAISGSIAHEMRTPMSIVGINADNLSAIIKNSSCNNKDVIMDMLKNIKFAVKSGSHIVNMLLTKLHRAFCKENPESHKKFPIESIKNSLNEAIKEYPFYYNERDYIIWDYNSNEDFIYRGDNTVIKQIIFNLIKNALWAIKEADRGEIYIFLKKGASFNYLVFKDTALGISSKIISTLFEPFVKYRKNGTGLGLYFCKTSMQTFGGDIICDAKEEEYTEFTLSFPVTSTEG